MSRFTQSEVNDILNEPDDDVTEAPVETPEPTSEVEAVVESPEPVVPETSAPATDAETAQPITREDGAVWSEKAQRWYKGGVIVAGTKPETPSEPSIPKVETPPPLTLAPDGQKAQPVAIVGEPWTVRGAGQKHAIPGALLTADGKLVVEGPENIARHRDIVAAGIQHLTNYGREKQQWTEQIKQAEVRGEASARKYNAASAFLFDKLSGFLAEHPQELDLIKRELQIQLKAADLDIPKAQQPVEREPEQVEQQFSHTLASSVDELLEDAPKGSLTAEDIADIKQTVARRMAAYAAEVDGEVVLDFHALRDDVQREIKLIQRAQQQAAKATADAQKAKAAAAFNAANAPKITPPTPRKPTPTPALSGAPSGQKPSWDQSFKSAFSDDDSED